MAMLPVWQMVPFCRHGAAAVRCARACNWTDSASCLLTDPAFFRFNDTSALLFSAQLVNRYMCLAESFPGVGLAGSTCPKTVVSPVLVSRIKLLGCTCPVEFTSDLLQDAALFHCPGPSIARQAPCPPLPVFQRDREEKHPDPCPS
ncbi:unnamed protein product [Effrenium voratum]|uniref:Uncharacterized protein n=1 Tax=Effrenium voratum TaxID=2562239 RepID=A0AA36I6S5_9DINO|nr:unnamed protein product [Effrenium voratum]CAJ1445053.1 unnamed protein product [Effrenium voratum]